MLGPYNRGIYNENSLLLQAAIWMCLPITQIIQNKFHNIFWIILFIIKTKMGKIILYTVKIRIFAELREYWIIGGWAGYTKLCTVLEVLSLFLEHGSIYTGVSCRNIVFVTIHSTPSLWLCAFRQCFTTH